MRDIGDASPKVPRNSDCKLHLFPGFSIKTAEYGAGGFRQLIQRIWWSFSFKESEPQLILTIDLLNAGDVLELTGLLPSVFGSIACIASLG